jgi:hypothetical protein
MGILIPFFWLKCIQNCKSGRYAEEFRHKTNFKNVKNEDYFNVAWSVFLKLRLEDTVFKTERYCLSSISFEMTRQVTKTRNELETRHMLWKDIYQRIFISYPKIVKKDIPISLFWAGYVEGYDILILRISKFYILSNPLSILEQICQF